MQITLYLPPDGHAATLEAVKRTQRLRLYVVPRIIGGLLLAMGAAVLVLGAVSGIDGVVWYGLSPAAIGLFYLFRPVWLLALMRRRVARIPDEPRTVTITDQGVAVAAVTAAASFAWSSVSGVVETDELFILRRFRMVGLALPKSAFSPSDEAAFRAVLAGRQLLAT